ncbi:MAG: CHRD domain-containing protein [Chloroflexota bacterium]
MRTIRILVALMMVAMLTVALTATASAVGGRPLSTDLNGAEEVPGPGDPDGSGWASMTVNPGRGVICYSLEVEGIEPAAAAHIHIGPAGVAGPVVVGLTAPTSGNSSGCTDVERSLAIDIIRNPSDYYVNVHNASFPAGALRGQLGD